MNYDVMPLPIAKKTLPHVAVPFYCAMNNLWEKSREYRGIFQVKNREKTRQIRENCSQKRSISESKKGTKQCFRQGKRSLLACHTRCQCFMETTRNSLKVKLGFRVIKLGKSLIGLEVTVTSGGSECH